MTMDDHSYASRRDMVAVGRVRVQRAQLSLLKAMDASRELERAVSCHIKTLGELEEGQSLAAHAYEQRVLAGEWAAPLQAFMSKGLEDMRRQELLLEEERQRWQENMLQVHQAAGRVAKQEERLAVCQELLAQSEVPQCEDEG